MKLVGFSFSAHSLPPFWGPQPPLGHGYLPMSDLAGVIGPNDTGKSSLLRLLHEHLADKPRDSPPRGMFFAECGPEEFQALTGHAISDLWQREADPSEVQPASGNRSWWWNPTGIGEGVDTRTLDLARDEPITAWFEALLDTADDLREAWTVVLSAAIAPAVAVLAKKEPPNELGLPLIGIEPGWPLPNGSPALWNLFWCLPPLDQLGKQLQNALASVGLTTDEDDPELWTSWAETGLRGDARTGEMFPPTPHRRVREAPIVVAPVGRTALPITPRALHLPIGFPRLRSEVSQTVERSLERVRWARTIMETVEQGEGVVDGPSGDEAWAEVSEDGAVRAHPDLLQLSRIVAGTVDEMVPTFVRDRYRVSIAPTLPTTWGAGERLRLRLSSRDGPGSDFDLEACAEGLHLWLQLGLLEALELITDQCARVGAAADRLSDIYQDAELTAGVDVESAEEKVWEAQSQLAAMFDQFDEADRVIIEPAQGGEGYLSIIPGGGYSPQLPAALQLARGRLYILDEPERHLHPRLQRQAARWLWDTIRRHGAQAVFATHSLPFLELTEAVAYTYTCRPRGHLSVLRPIDPRSLTHLDEEAQELGIDRGELMALTNVFLWVEGRMDQAVLEGLYRDELRRYGIAVVPMHSVSRHKGILDAEALLRFTAAKPAAWFDNVPEEFVTRLRSDAGFAHDARGDRELSSECRAVAELVIASRQREIEVEVIPHPAKDIFDLLDEDVIREWFPGFPGHGAAAAAWAKADRPAGERKAFMRQHFGVEITVAACRQIAERMRAKEREAPALRNVIDTCERLALDLD